MDKKIKQTIRKWKTKDIPYWMSSNDEYGVILTRNGCVSVAFRMYNPECYSLHRTDLEERNARLYQAFNTCPPAASCTSRTCSLKGVRS